MTKTTELAKTWLDAYRTPAIDETAHEELKAFVQRRVSEGGVATDF